MNREEALQKLIEEVVEDDMFDDNSFLDDEYDDYNLGYQAGTLDERERIMRLLDINLGNVDWKDLIKLIKKDTHD